METRTLVSHFTFCEWEDKLTHDVPHSSRRSASTFMSLGGASRRVSEIVETRVSNERTSGNGNSRGTSSLHVRREVTIHRRTYSRTFSSEGREIRLNNITRDEN